MKQALIFDPYFDSLGGGEKYVSALAAGLAGNGWSVSLAWKEESILTGLNHRFGYRTSAWKVNPELYYLFTQKGSLAEKYQKTRPYDFIFYLSDGSVPFLFGKKNWVHFQVPFRRTNTNYWLNALKWLNVNRIICNSCFTEKIIRQTYRLKSKTTVVYPPVNIVTATDWADKQNIILSVGRFDEIMHSKRQETLIKVFKKLNKEGLTGWKLVLIGGAPENSKLVKTLQKEASGLPIEIITNASFSFLKKYLVSAKIYWHAAGYGIKEDEQPEKVEHFGVSAVEAMGAGSVPVVIGKGGLKEVIHPGKNGYFWENEDELKNITLNLINNSALCRQISRSACQRANLFSEKVFQEKIRKLLDNNY